ncbi:MAG: PAS domain-containing protein [Nannocystaceae bacterium]|nr:PAS domain-containing protein [Nannocystaceae bacterium]
MLPARRKTATLGALTGAQLIVSLALGIGLGRVAPEARVAIWSALAVGLIVSVATTALGLAWAQRELSRTLRSLVASVQSREPRPTLPEDTEIAGLAGSVHRMADELDTALRSLAAERDRFEAVLETMAPAVLALDRERCIATANRSARRLFALRDSWQGRPLLEQVRAPALHELLDRVAAGEPETAEFELPSPLRSVQARASRLADGGLVVVADDVTDIRRLERVRRDFVANVSHELRTPIAVIRANAETLLDGALEHPEAARRFVEALYRHADRLTRLIGDLLDISRIEAGKRVLSLEPLELSDLTTDVILTLEQDAKAKSISLHSEVDPGLYVMGDLKALEQVLVNLVDNAVKYTPAGGHVELSAARDGEQVRIEVRDDGPGIEPQHAKRIFERFYRVDSGRSREAGGTGLGLSIVKHLVEAMGGSVGVDPRSPRGSIFWVTVPLGDVPEDAESAA